MKKQHDNVSMIFRSENNNSDGRLIYQVSKHLQITRLSSIVKIVNILLPNAMTVCILFTVSLTSGQYCYSCMKTVIQMSITLVFNLQNVVL